MIFPFLSAAVYATRDQVGTDQFSTRACNQTTLFVRAQVSRLPRFIRVGVLILIGLSIVACVLRHGRTPSHLAPRDRDRFYAGLAKSRLTPIRDLGRLLTSFALMGLFSFQDPA